MGRLRLIILLGLAALGSLAQAADPQPYRVDIASTGNGDIDDTLEATSDLRSLRTSAPVSPFGLIARGRSDVDRLTTALESFGYYQCAVMVNINGMRLKDPGLAAALAALPKDSEARVAISLTLGPLYHLRRIDIDGQLPASVDGRGTLGLTTGQAAVASTVLAGGARLLSALQEQGYAFAAVDPPVAYEAADGPMLDLKFHVSAGPKVNIGEIRVQGLRRVHESVVRKRLRLRTGEPYSPTAIERARNDLLGLGVFGQVSVRIGTAVDSSGGVPITFAVRERLRHAAAVNAAYSSDLGGSGGIKWSDRNLFGNADQLNLAASVINFGGSDTTGVGYDTSAKYIKPDFGRYDQSLQIAVGAIRQSLQAYDQKALTSGVTLNRKLSSVWSASAGLATADEQIIQESIRHNYTLLELPLTLSYDSTNLSNPLEDPRHGIRASVNVVPTLAIGSPNAMFVITQIKIAGFLDLHDLISTDPGRSVLAVRALAGIAQGAGELSLPPDQRFYGGGSGTIRGYAYQSVGPKFVTDGTPIGGTAITAGSVELRQRFGTNFGAAAFVDAGQVSASLKAVPDEFRIGVGLGLRYYTPIGPIRLDVAVPTKRHSVTITMPSSRVITDDAFEIYIGLGQSF